MSQASPSSTSRTRFDLLWLACSLLAAVMLAASAWLPLWTMELRAPQYPHGLELTAYGTTLEGDLQEVNTVNHYVGVRPISTDDIPELALFPYLLGALVGALLLGSVFARHWLLRLALRLGVWGFAVGFLVDLQWWLYRSGHDRNADAPYRIEDFTPRVLGGTRVVNFDSETMVASGYWLILGAALLLSFGPPLIRFLVASWRNTGDAGSSAGRLPAQRRPEASASERRGAA